MAAFPAGVQVPTFIQVTFRERRSRYAVVIPVLDEGERIRAQLEGMAPFMEATDTILVDGGSRDGSTDERMLEGMGLRALLVKTGPGRLGAQLRVGLAWAMEQGYDGVILMDGNNKDDPSAIPRFMETLDGGFDHVQGSRFVSGGRAVDNPVVRLAAIRWLHAPLLSLAAGFRYTDTTNGFRAYSRKLLMDDRVLPFREVFGGYELHYYLAVRAPRLGFRTVEIPVCRTYPRGRVPTKISMVGGNLRVLAALIKSMLGRFNP